MRYEHHPFVTPEERTTEYENAVSALKELLDRAGYDKVDRAYSEVVWKERMRIFEGTWKAKQTQWDRS